MSTPDTTAAEAYERYLVSKVFGPWAARAVELAAPQPGEAVLDLACGTGIATRLAAPLIAPGGSVVAADSDPAMIAVAARLAAELPETVELDWLARPAEEALVEDASIDLCLYLQGPQFVSDPPAAMARVAAALKPDGRLVASAWGEMSRNRGHYAIGQALEKRGLKPALKPFSLGKEGALAALVEGADLAIEFQATEEKVFDFPSVAAFVEGVAAGAPATRHALAQLSDADRAAFQVDVESLLADRITGQGVSLPTVSQLLVARRLA